MSSTGKIDILGGDDDEDRDNLNEDNLPEGAQDFDPAEFEVTPPDAPEPLPEFDAPETTNTEEFKSLEDLQKAPTEKQLEAQAQKEINALKQEAKQELAATKKELKKQFRREVRDEAKANRREKKALNREATQRRKEIRSMATQNRIGTYSLASAFGAKGYVVASAIDALVFRPQEEAAIAQERTYTDQVEEHFQKAEDELQQRKDDFEDDLDKMKPRSVDEEAIRASKGLKSNPPQSAPPSPGGTSGYSGGSGNRYNPPSNNPPGNSPPGNNLPPPPLPPPGPPTPPPVPPTPPPQSLPQGPPGLPPIPPPLRGGLGGSSNIAGTAAMITLAMEVGKVISEGIEKLGNTARDNVKATFSDRPSDLIRQQSKNLELLEPVTNLNPGTTLLNLGLQESVDVFADAVDKFDQYSRKNLAFSPEALTQSIEGQIDRLTQTMEIAQRLDGQKARNIDAIDRLVLSFEEFKARVFSFFEPFLTTLVNMANGILIVLNSILAVLEFIFSKIPGVAQLMQAWKAMNAKKSLHQTVIDRQEEFLNTKLPPIIVPNRARGRNNP